MQRAGEPLDREQYAALEARALRLLARREHSVRELETKLRARAGAPAEPAGGPDLVRAVITDLAARELVSDARFAAAWARD
ncbi:MAG: regulatory protein RecX, partial [Gemmatimonadota bacterium]